MRTVPRLGRAARSPVPVPVLLAAVLGGCAIALPFLGLGTRVGWGQLPQVLSSGPARAALGLSLVTCLAATAISVLLGVPLAVVLARQWPGVRAARVLAVLPMTMPPVVAGIALLSTLGRRGLLGPALEEHGLQISFTTAAVVIAQVFVSMPYLVVTLEAALRSRDDRAETIARTLGADPWRVLTRITLPLAAPALARGTALALGRSLGEFGATIAFAGSREGVTRTMPLAIYLERENDTGTSLALAVVLIALSALVVATTAIDWAALAQAARMSSLLPCRRAGAGAGLLPGGPCPADAPRPGGRTGTAAGPGEQDGPALRATPAPGAGQATGTPGQALRVSFTSRARGVSVALDVPAGAAVALIGPNGSGKSTVCSVVAGLADAEDGEVAIGARVVDGPDGFVPAGCRGVALLAQSPGVFAHMSVLGNVAFGPRCRGVTRSRARERARAELAAAGAAHLAGRPGSQLSGGQAARVALARALATDPAVLVLDEPMAALDVTARQELRALVSHRVRERGITLLLVTHDVLDLTALADEVIVLEDGRVAESGPVARVLAAPSSRFAARLTGTSVLFGVLAGDAAAPVLVLGAGARLAGRPGPDWTGVAGRPGLALVPPDAVALYHRGEYAAGSPRNALPVRVTSLDRAGALVTAGLRLADGQSLSAVLTAGAVAGLGVEPGARLTAVVKAVQVRILPGAPDQR